MDLAKYLHHFKGLEHQNPMPILKSVPMHPVYTLILGRQAIHMPNNIQSAAGTDVEGLLTETYED